MKISQKIEKNAGDLRRVAVTLTPVRNNRLTLVWKSRKGVNNNLFTHINMFSTIST